MLAEIQYCEHLFQVEEVSGVSLQLFKYCSGQYFHYLNHVFHITQEGH